MLAPIIIFGIALVTLFVFLFVRMYKIRTGQITVTREEHTENRRVYTKVVETKEKTAWYSKNMLKLIVLGILKFLVFVGFVFKQLAHEIKETVKEKFTPKREDGEKKDPTAFIKTMREYKKELRSFQKKLDRDM